MVPVSAVLGVSVGPLLEAPAYDSIFKAAFEALSEGDHRQAFCVGWTGMGYRARAASDSVQRFRTMFGNEPAASSEERRQQEDSFFGFLTNGTAAAENLFYAVYVLALGLEGVPVSAVKLSAKRKDMASRITGRLGEVGSYLLVKGEESSAVEMFAMRDVVLHRGRLARNHYVGGPNDGHVTVAANPKELPTVWKNEFRLSSTFLDQWESWLKELLVESSRKMSQLLSPPR